MANILYNQFKAEVMKALVDLDNAAYVLKVALFTSSLVSPNKDDDSYSSPPYTTNESTGTGYTIGGATLAGKTVVVDDTNDCGTFDATDLTWADVSTTARYALIYADSHASKIPIVLFDFGQDLTAVNGDFSLVWNANGIIRLL